jgi:SAM-dependent methyltransferase
MSTDFEERYRSGDTPWDHGTPDHNLVDTVRQHPVPACRALDIGCGTGENVLWLARHGFESTGCDLSVTAIETARQKALETGIRCSFITADFLHDTISGMPFGFALDRGCLHSVEGPMERARFAENVSAHLAKGGLWLTLAGNADEPAREIGPPQLTARELTAAVEPCFEILSLRSGFFGSDQPVPPRAWIGLMQRR